MLFLALFAALLAVSTAATTNNTASADTLAVCDYLYGAYPRFLVYNPLGPKASVTLANASVYNDSNKVYWNNVDSYDYRAACAFSPESAEQVSTAVKHLLRYPSVQYAIKAGGHNPAPGHSAVSGGVLISFETNLASTVRSDDGNHFFVGPGARWGDVYTVTGKTKQIVVGGRLAHIGVGGFILGGGLSYYSAQYGLACDNVADFEVVLADGTITHANATSEPELYFSLKGGGNQFAIVTKFKLKAHPEGVDGQVWGGLRAYSSSDYPKLNRAITRFIATYPDTKAAIIPSFQFGLPLNLLNVVTGPIFFFFYDGPTPPAGVFDEFDNITAVVDTTDTMSYYDVSQQAGGAALVGFGNAFREITYPNLPEDQMVEFLNHYWERSYEMAFGDSLKDLVDLQITGFTPQPVSVKLIEASNAQGENALGLDPHNGDRIWIENQFLWSNRDCKDKCPAFAKETADDLMAYQIANFGGVAPTNYISGDLNFTNYNPLFMNDAGPDQDPYTSYGAANLARLQAAKAKYDPHGFFTDRQGGFKLPS